MASKNGFLKKEYQKYIQLLGPTSTSRLMFLGQVTFRHVFKNKLLSLTAVKI